ncbi:MAG: hypothetical protein J1E65_03000 [Lachnospiraceae bacterium]|nr:hypothetical protein [Lachnospiraceae bacterium]
MKLKIYLRGLGIGILVTAVIMGIASSRRRQMTDEEIKARARELGMVESTTLSAMASGESQGNPTPSQAPDNTPASEVTPSASPEESTPSPSPVNTPAVSESPSPSPEESVPEVTVSPSPSSEENIPESSPVNTPAESVSPSVSPEENTPEPSPSPDSEQEVPAGEYVTITIRSGQSSVAVSKMLEEAGLVESASAYDKYLCENGYDKRLKTGNHEIPVGATEEEIARIITSKGN